jgi:hypothetical protein
MAPVADAVSLDFIRQSSGNSTVASACDIGFFNNEFSPSTKAHGNCTTPTQRNRFYSEASTNVSDATDHAGQDDSQKGGFARKHVLALLGELQDAFQSQDFQEQLQPLLKDPEDPQAEFAREELALSVQSKILPEYGLPGTMEGVSLMLEECAPFVGDWMVRHLVEKIDETLGEPAGATLERMSYLSSMSSSGVGMSITTPVALTRTQLLDLAGELLDAFSSPNFQERLQPLLASKLYSARVELALTVQSRILPKYGLAGNSGGVFRMLEQIVPCTGDWMVRHVVDKIDVALGDAEGTTLEKVAHLQCH